MTFLELLSPGTEPHRNLTVKWKNTHIHAPFLNKSECPPYRSINIQGFELGLNSWHFLFNPLLSAESFGCHKIPFWMKAESPEVLIVCFPLPLVHEQNQLLLVIIEVGKNQEKNWCGDILGKHSVSVQILKTVIRQRRRTSEKEQHATSSPNNKKKKGEEW